MLGSRHLLREIIDFMTAFLSLSGMVRFTQLSMKRELLQIFYGVTWKEIGGTWQLFVKVNEVMKTFIDFRILSSWKAFPRRNPFYEKNTPLEMHRQFLSESSERQCKGTCT